MNILNVWYVFKLFNLFLSILLFKSRHVKTINFQGSKGIRHWPINLYTSPMDTQNYPFCRLQLVVGTFGHSVTNQSKFNKNKIPKVVEPTNNKTLL